MVALAREAPAPSAAADSAARLRAALERAERLDDIAALALTIPDAIGGAIDGSTDVRGATTCISALNDVVTDRVVRACAAQCGIDLARACWLAFGSQARGEQTLVSDQDNGLVFIGEPGLGADAREAERQRWMAFGARANEALARCGQALCSGRVMAGQRLCCLTPEEWCLRFEHWMAHGSSNDLLAARIYFDLRPIVGNLALADPLRAVLRSPAARVPRFLKQMAEIALCNHPPLNWLGRVVTVRREQRAMFDLKMSGSAMFVDAARLWALAFGIEDAGTVPRLRAAAASLRIPNAELEQWLEGFLTLQRLRLQVQRARAAAGVGAAFDVEERSFADWDQLDQAQRGALKRALVAARWMQQRIALDYRR
jgi:CBS domain-containing protein